MLRAGFEANVRKGLIDSSLYEELQYSFQCRMVNVLTFYPDTPQQEIRAVFELQSVKV